MDPSPLLHPVGPEPPRVYWVRRAGLAALLVVLIVAVAYACAGGGSDGDQRLRSDDRPSPTATATTPAPKPVVHRCGAKRLRVEAATDTDSYPAGSTPRLTAVVMNVGNDPCRLATQPSARTWSISSGADQVWSTDDCARKGPVSLKRLKAGHQVTYAVTWDGNRSEPGCASPGDAAQPGTYRLEVTVDGARAQPVVFHLTG
jgi:hypothetical protein